MPQTPFHAYYKARLLEQLPEAEQFLPVFASSDIEIYPFQIAAASFALRSPYQKGAVLCDEAGMGKSHEAMLVINQKWLEGCSRILLVIPNADLLHQWTEMLERFYTVPYVVLTNRRLAVGRQGLGAEQIEGQIVGPDLQAQLQQGQHLFRTTAVQPQGAFQPGLGRQGAAGHLLGRLQEQFFILVGKAPTKRSSLWMNGKARSRRLSKALGKPT